MAEFRIIVTVDPSQAVRGTRRVDKALNRTASTAQRLQSTLRRAFVFLGLVEGSRRLIGLADAFTQVQNRIRVVTKSEAELEVVTNKLFESATRTRSEFRSTAEVYARVSLATRELGISQQQTLDFTESLNQAVILSGASAQEASAGLIQLAQGLGSNRLSGDELRSVLEQLSVVADVIAKKMGVARGALRGLGEQGKITASIVLEAFKEARQELAIKFAKTIPTIGQAFVLLNNQAVKLFGEFTTGTGVSRGLVDTIKFLAENLETVLRTAAALGIVLAINLTRRGIVVATRAMIAFTASIVTNPIGALLTTLTVATAAFIAFADEVPIGTGRLATLEDVGVAAFESVSEVAADLFVMFQESFPEMAELARTAFKDVDFSVEGFARGAARSVDFVIGAFKGLVTAVPKIFENFAVDIDRIFTSILNSLLQILVKSSNLISKAINSILVPLGAQALSILNPVVLDVPAKSKRLGSIIGESIAEGIESQTAAEDALNSLLAKAEDIARRRLAGEAEAERARKAAEQGLLIPGQKVNRADPAFEKLLEDLAKEARGLREVGREREIVTTLLKAEKDLKRELTATEEGRIRPLIEGNLALKDQQEILEDIRAPAEEYALALAALIKLEKAGKISSDQLTVSRRQERIELLETQRTAAAGVERALLKIQESSSDFATSFEQAVTNSFSAATTALEDFFATGEFGFEQMINSIIKDLTRLAIQRAILAPLGDLFSGGGSGEGAAGAAGGLLSNLGSFEGILNGGSLSSLFSFGAAHGAQFTVGGSGGTDQTPVSFMATRGEEVTVRTPGQQRSGRGITQQFFLNDAASDEFRRNPRQVMSRAAAGITRASGRA